MQIGRDKVEHNEDGETRLVVMSVNQWHQILQQFVLKLSFCVCI